MSKIIQRVETEVLSELFNGLELNDYTPILKEDTVNSQNGVRYRVVRSDNEDFILNFNKAYKEGANINDTSYVKDTLEYLFNQDCLELVDGISYNKGEELVITGKLKFDDYELKSDYEEGIGELIPYLNINIPVVGRVNLAITMEMLRCKNQIPYLSSNPLNKVINLDEDGNKKELNLELYKSNIISTISDLKEFRDNPINLQLDKDTNTFTRFCSKVFRVEDIEEEKPRVINKLLDIYNDKNVPNNLDIFCLLKYFNAITYYYQSITPQNTILNRVKNAKEIGIINNAYGLCKSIIKQNSLSVLD